MVTPLKKFLTKHPTPSGMSSRQWAALSAAMREEKFFSARVENVRLLERLQGMIRDFLTGEREVLENGESVMKVGSCADFVKQAMDWLEAEGLREADGEGEEYHRDVSHVGAEARLRLIFRTNVRQAVGAAQWESAMMPANLKAWPAFRFVRFPGAKVKRPVHVANEDEVRLKSDFEFWADEMNAADLGGFEVPWPPFGFNSYMDQIPVSRKECEAMGLLKPGEPLKRPRGAERFGIDLVERYGYGKKASTAKLPEELKAKLKKYYEDRWGVKQDGADKVVFPAKQVADMAKKEAEQLELALFTPARTREEAIEFTRCMAKEVSFADSVTLKQLNELNETIFNLKNKYNVPYLKRIGSTQIKNKRGKSLDDAGAHASHSILEINHDREKGGIHGLHTWKDYETMYRSNLDVLKDSWEQAVKKGNNSLASVLKRDINKLEKKLLYSRHNVGASKDGISIKDVVTHEFGHVLHLSSMVDEKGSSFLTKGDLERLRTARIVSNALKTAKSNKDIFLISEYSGKNMFEFFAESFAAFERGEKLPDYIIEMIKKIIKTYKK